MESKEDNTYWLEKFRIKSCAVNLERVEFKKIRITCTATCLENNLKIHCNIQQGLNGNANTFRITPKCKEGKNNKFIFSFSFKFLIVLNFNYACISFISSNSIDKRRRNQSSIKMPIAVEIAKKRSNAVMRASAIKKPLPAESVEVGEVVLCKMKGYPEWPGFVEIIDNKGIHIRFFGDNTTTHTNIKNIYKFVDSTGVILHNLRTKKKPSYAKAVKEAEMMLNISPEKSLFNLID